MAITPEEKQKRRIKRLLKKAFFEGNRMARRCMDHKNEGLTKDFIHWYNQQEK